MSKNQDNLCAIGNAVKLKAANSIWDKNRISKVKAKLRELQLKSLTPKI